MAISCPTCQTQLIGAVNRCWNCGNEIPPSLALVDAAAETADTTAGTGAQETVQETARPVGGPEENDDSHESDVVEATLQAPQPTAPTSDTDTGFPPTEPVSHSPPRVEGAANDSIDVGAAPLHSVAVADSSPGPNAATMPESPFAEPTVGRFADTPTPAAYPSKLPNMAGALLSVILGVAALIEIRLFPTGAVVTGMIGIGCGLWGIRSNRRVSSTFGIVLCSVAVVWGLFNVAVTLYIDKYNVNPFAPNVPVEPVPDEDDLGF